jgi:hypothetical protein
VSNDSTTPTRLEKRLIALRAIWEANQRQRDLLAFIRACPQEDWECLFAELEKLLAERWAA